MEAFRDLTKRQKLEKAKNQNNNKMNPIAKALKIGFMDKVQKTEGLIVLISIFDLYIQSLNLIKNFVRQQDVDSGLDADRLLLISENTKIYISHIQEKVTNFL